MNQTGLCFQRSNSTEPQLIEVFTIFVEVYLVMFLCVAGILGNTLSILVLGRDRTMRRTTAYLLQMVAVADTLYLTTCIFYQSINTIYKLTDWIPSLQFYWPYFVPYMWPCASIAQTCTVWLVLVLTADRYIAICKPLHAPMYSTISRMRKVVIMIYILSIAYNVPRFFERYVHQELDPITNKTKTCAIKAGLRENKHYIVFYKTCSFFVLRVIIPLSLLAFFNTKLMQAIRQSSKLAKIRGSSRGSAMDRQTGSGGRRRDRQQHTRILVVVVLVFILFEMPDFFLRVYISLSKNFPKVIPFPRDNLLYVNVLSNLCLTLNSCTNFVIYCFLGRKFRVILRGMLCKKERKQCVPRKVILLQSGCTHRVVMQNSTPMHESYALLANGSSTPEHLYG